MTVIVFDVGGVLVKEADRFGQLASSFSAHGIEVDPMELEKAYWKHRDSYDLGMTDEEYWETTLRIAGVEERQIDNANFKVLGDLDGAQNAAIKPEPQELLENLGKTESALFILSNAPFSMARALREAPQAPLFSYMAFSCETGVAKPSAGAYEAIEKHADRPAQDIMFFDDRPANVSAAVERGWDAHLWESASQAREILSNRGIL